VLGARTCEAIENDDGMVELLVVVQAVTSPGSRNEVDVAALARCGIEADNGDELLFPIFYRRDDVGQAHHQVQSGLAALLGLPADTIELMQRALVAAAAN